MSLGTLQSDNGDVHENVLEKQTPHAFKPEEATPEFRQIVEYIALSSRPQKRLKIWALHVVIVQGRQKQCTKKRDAYAELLFC